MYIYNYLFFYYLGLVKTEVSLMIIVIVIIMEIMNWIGLKLRLVCFYRIFINFVFYICYIYMKVFDLGILRLKGFY